MEDKIDLIIKCPNNKCPATITIRKKRYREALDLVCPDCKKSLHIDFDISVEPQSYEATIVGQKEGEDVSRVSKGKKDTIYPTAHHKTPHNVCQELDEDEETPIHNHKKLRLMDKIYLTHVKYFGLIKDRYRLSEGKTIVGRYDKDLPSDISLKGDNTISRQSIIINIEADNYGFDYKLRVVNATNIVRVNNQLVRIGEEVFLEFGDVIILGNTKLIFDNK